eukprot:m.90145 g.90145  ORF g.90145 m.90145 type:complete len:369 (+) comp12908_c0_seq1:1647-2753(+)
MSMSEQTGERTASTLPLTAALGDQDLKELCRALPKVELHRHLTGGFPRQQLQDILERDHPKIASDVRLVTPQAEDTPEGEQRAWDILVKQCHAVKVASEREEDLYTLVGSAIKDLAADGIVYCEYRIGIKPQPTKRTYLDVLERAIRDNAHFGVTVKLLVSVARHGDVDYARESVEVAIEAFHSGTSAVVGVELGGIGTKGHWHDFRPLFQMARDAGMKIALHSGEAKEGRQEEFASMLDFKPERLGHCVFFDEANMKRLLATQIPVETCLTCHALVYNIPVPNNIASTLLDAKHPFCLATDNPSFYSITLSDEYYKLIITRHLSWQQLAALCRDSLQFAFAHQSVKQTLTQAMETKLSLLAANYSLT